MTDNATSASRSRAERVRQLLERREAIWTELESIDMSIYTLFSPEIQKADERREGLSHEFELINIGLTDVAPDLLAENERLLAELARERERAEKADLQAVLHWLSDKRKYIHQQAEPLKGDIDALWDSGLLEELATCDEWYAEVYAQIDGYIAETAPADPTPHAGSADATAE